MRKLQPLFNPKVGDDVFSPTFGNGKIINIDEEDLPFPITVYFLDCFILNNTQRETFTPDGRYYLKFPISLFQGHVNEPYDLSVDEVIQTKIFD